MNMIASNEPKIEPNCLCGCPAEAHPGKWVLQGTFDGSAKFDKRFVRRGCGVLDMNGKPHCYGYVSPEDEIDA